MRKTLFFAALAGLMLALTACGSDEPEINRDNREMKVKALTHVLNTTTHEATLTIGDENTYSMHITALKADMVLNIPIDGAKQVFNITNVALTRDGETYRFSFNQAQTSNAAVTNLRGIIDMSDPMAIFQCDVNGHHVCVNIPDVFFNQVSLNFDYGDDIKSTYNHSNWITQVATGGQKANMLISDIEIAKDMREAEGTFKRLGQFLQSLKVSDVGLEVTETGYRLTASQATTTGVDGTGLTTNYLIDGKSYPYYTIRDLVNDVNLTSGTMTASFVLRHVLTYDKEGSDAGRPTQVDDINVTASGKFFKDSNLN